MIDFEFEKQPHEPLPTCNAKLRFVVTTELGDMHVEVPCQVDHVHPRSRHYYQDADHKVEIYWAD